MKPDDQTGATNKPDDEPANDAHAGAGPEAGAHSAQNFAGALDNFGLTPRPKVKSQRVDPLLGMDLGGVKIVRLIGEGGMGRVYEALQDKPARTVAVKIIRAGITSEKTMKRFEREAEFLGRLQHPGIAHIFVVGAYESDMGSVPFYVMEFIPDAKPITNYAHEHGLSLADRLQLFKQVCEAVSHGHDRSIVHRDLKPGNILVDAAGNPKVIDFGVARSTDSDLTLESIKTDSGALVGTVQYMSPEQFGSNPDDLNSRTDVYSLGVVLYELISGVPPYSVSKRALHEASRVVCEQVPLPLRALDRTVPKDVSAIVARCLEKNRRHRYHSAGELAAEIGSFLAGKPVRARPSSPIGRMRLPAPVRALVTQRTGLVALCAAVLAIGGYARFGGAGLWLVDGYSPHTVQLKASAQWVPTSLPVREGLVYRLVVTGSCKDQSGVVFGPDGAAPVQPAESRAKAFKGDLTRCMLLGKVSDSRIVLPVGESLTFVAPWTGTLSFRVNDDDAESGQAVTGQFRVTLEPIMRPLLVGKDGTTTIRARVGTKRHLLFEPEGIRWQYEGFQSALDETESPAFINGIAWWPLPDRPNTEGWREFTLSRRTPLLRTRAFAWAADPTGPHPVVVNAPSNPSDRIVTAEGPAPDAPGLTFPAPRDGNTDLSCTISRP